MLKTIGAVGAGLSVAGCMGNQDDGAPGGQNQNDKGDATVTPTNQDEGLWDTETTFLDAQTPQDVVLNKINLYQTETTVGVQGRACNKRGQPITKLVVHARLLKENGDEFDVFQNSLEQAALEDLGANECWSFTIDFTNADPQQIAKQVANVEVWATLQTTGNAASDEAFTEEEETQLGLDLNEDEENQLEQFATDQQGLTEEEENQLGIDLTEEEENQLEGFF